MFRWLSGAFPSVSGLIPLQGKSEYGWILVPGGRIVFFSSPGVVEDVLNTRASWQGKKISIWVLETWDHHHWMPVKYGILIYVSHLGSSSLPCWATRWTRSLTSRGTSTGQEIESILEFSSVISTCLAMLSVWMDSGVVMHMDIETQERVNHSRAMFPSVPVNKL